MNEFLNPSCSVMSISMGIYKSARQMRLLMIKAGFFIDYENDVYVKEPYGAYKDTIDYEIKSVNDLKNYYDEESEENPYEDVFILIEKGYKFVIGPGAPYVDGKVYGNGLYCKNYKDIMK